MIPATDQKVGPSLQNRIEAVPVTTTYYVTRYINYTYTQGGGGQGRIILFSTRKGKGMKYVYSIQSIPYPDRHYIGITNNPEESLKEHNSGKLTL